MRTMRKRGVERNGPGRGLGQSSSISAANEHRWKSLKCIYSNIRSKARGVNMELHILMWNHLATLGNSKVDLRSLAWGHWLSTNPKISTFVYEATSEAGLMFFSARKVSPFPKEPSVTPTKEWAHTDQMLEVIFWVKLCITTSMDSTSKVSLTLLTLFCNCSSFCCCLDCYTSK